MPSKDLETTDRIGQDIKEDIQSFQEIIEAIKIVLNELKAPEEIKEALQRIALSSQKIHRNGKRDGKERYLRNKYSTNDYVKDKVRTCGINFDLLSEINLLPEEILTPEFDPILSDIKEVLNSVMQKLALAIHVEEGNRDYQSAIKAFNKLSTIDLQENIFKKAISINAGKKYFTHILVTLDHLSNHTLNLQNKEDRYFLGMNLAIIGETAKKIEIISGLDEGVLRIFKLIRNRTAHNNGFMVGGIPNEQHDIYKFILDKLARDLRTVANTAIARFDAVKSQDQLSNLDISFGIYTNQQRSILKKLLEVISGGKNINLTEEDFSQFDSPINFLIPEQSKAKRQKPNLSDRAEVRISLAAPAAVAAPVAAPAAVAATTKKTTNVDQTLDTKLKNLKRLLNTKMLSETNAAVKFNESCLQQGIDFANIINESVRTSGNMNFPFFEENVFPTQDALDAISKYLKKNASLRDLEITEPNTQSDDESEVEIETTEPIVVTQENKAQKIKIDPSQLVKKYEFIANEVDFIFTIIKNTSLTDFKKDLIIKFAVAKIGQAYRDIEESCLDEQVSNLQSEMHRKSTRISAETRNHIMHNILDQDFNSSLAINLFRHILPLLKDIKALSRILQNKTDDIGMLVTGKRVLQLISVGMSYTDLMQYEKSIELYKEILFFMGIGKKNENLDSIIIEYKKNFEKIAKQISPAKLDINNDAFNCFYLIAYNYGLIGNRLKQNNEPAELYEGAHNFKIQILDILLELKKDMPDRQRAALLGNKALSYGKMEQYEFAFKYRLEAYLLINKIPSASEQDKASYLASLAVDAYGHFCIDIERIEITNEYQMEQIRYNIDLARSLLWWAKELTDQVGAEKNIEIYLQILLPLTKYTNILNEQDFAQELFLEYKSILDNTPMKKDDILIKHFNELKPLMSIGNAHKNIDKDKAILRLKSLIAIDVFFCNQQVDLDMMEFVNSSKEKIDQYALSDEERRLVNKLYTNHCGVSLFRKTQYKESIPKFLSLIADGHSDGEIFESLGDAYHAIGSYNPAINNFLKAFEQYATTYVGERAFAIPHKIIKSLSKTTMNNSEKLGNLQRIESSYLLLKEKVKSTSDENEILNIELLLLKQYDEYGDSAKVRSIAPVCKKSLKGVNFSSEDRDQINKSIDYICMKNMFHTQSVSQRRQENATSAFRR